MEKIKKIIERFRQMFQNKKYIERFRQLLQQKDQRWKLLAGAVTAVGVIGMSIICVQAYRRNRAEAELERLAENTDMIQTQLSAEDSENAGAETLPVGSDPTGAAGSDIQALTNMGIPIPEKEIDFADMQANVNKDIYAWIDIPDTKIDYPIVQHPTDNAYYLNFNLDGSRGYPGCIYTEDYNTKSFADPNTVVYGHNMKDGSMFAGLHQYRDREYFDAHPYIYIYTEEKLYVYEIFSAYEYSDEHILYSCDFTDSAEFEKYLENIYDMGDKDSNANVREDVVVTADDRILTLSTCVAQRPERRFLVQGVLLNED